MKAFVVYGSEDGNLGVYTTFKRSYLEAKRYLEQNGGQVLYSLKEAKNNAGNIQAVGDRKTYCSITEFQVNL